jgi:S1-C subfamily serine protease
MKHILTLVILAQIFIASSPLLALDGSSVKIIVTSQGYDYDAPWQKKTIRSSTIYGCVLPGNLILTNAYSMTDHVMVEVNRPGESKKFQAVVVVKDYLSGLALLTTEDPSFFRDITPVTLAEEGYLSGRQGVIRKWDRLGSVREYSAAVINTAIRTYPPGMPVMMHIMTTTMKSGGDGEPVYIDGKLVGISAGLDSNSRTLYVVASTTIKRMLKDASDGTYQGIPFFALEYMAIDSNTNLRNYLGMKENETGVFVSNIPSGSSGSDTLKPGDVIMEVGGRSISDDGMYEHPFYGRLNFYGLVNMEGFAGDTVKMKILRKGVRKEVSFTLRPIKKEFFLIPPISYDTQPRYMIFGGLIFQELTPGFMHTWGRDWAKKGDDRFLHLYGKDMKSQKKKIRRHIVLNRILPAPCNKGYENTKNLLLKRVNGVLVKNMDQLKKLLTARKKGFVVLDFMGGTRIVLEAREVQKFQDKILRVYNIQKCCQ